jgi:hypothetical protein
VVCEHVHVRSRVCFGAHLVHPRVFWCAYACALACVRLAETAQHGARVRHRRSLRTGYRWVALPRSEQTRRYRRPPSGSGSGSGSAGARASQEPVPALRVAAAGSVASLRGNSASRGTETSAEVLVGPPWRMDSNAGQQQTVERRMESNAHSDGGPMGHSAR